MPRLFRLVVIGLAGAWAALMLAAVIAVRSLMQVDSSEIAREPTEQVAVDFRQLDDQEVSALWSLGAIAFGCVVGSLMVAQRLNPSNPQRRLIKSRHE